MGKTIQVSGFPRLYSAERIRRYGCPGMDEIEAFSRQYKKSLDDKIPDDLALEVSSPGADRLLRVSLQT